MTGRTWVSPARNMNCGTCGSGKISVPRTPYRDPAAPWQHAVRSVSGAESCALNQPVARHPSARPASSHWRGFARQGAGGPKSRRHARASPENRFKGEGCGQNGTSCCPGNTALFKDEGHEEEALAIRCPTCGANPERSVNSVPANRVPSLIGVGAWWRRTSNSLRTAPRYLCPANLQTQRFSISRRRS